MIIWYANCLVFALITLIVVRITVTEWDTPILNRITNLGFALLALAITVISVVISINPMWRN